MRPVNLIPMDQRRGESAPVRTGPVAYIVVGFLAAVLVAVIAVVMLGNSIDDKKSEVASLEAQAAETQARSQALSPYVSFQQLRDARVETIGSLARSRFDWERVIREVTRLIPKGVWLKNMTGTVAPDVQIENSAGIPLRASVPGPALELAGCARSQTDIARLIASINDVDGVTRVTAVNGIKPNDPTADSGGAPAEGGAEGAGGDDTCPSPTPSFQLVAAFDEIVVPVTGTPGIVTPPSTNVPTSAGADTSADNAQGPGSAGTDSTTPPTLSPGG